MFTTFCHQAINQDRKCPDTANMLFLRYDLNIVCAVADKLIMQNQRGSKTNAIMYSQHFSSFYFPPRLDIDPLRRHFCDGGVPSVAAPGILTSTER